MRSPASPYSQRSKTSALTSPRTYYSTAPQSESATARTSQSYGLGIDQSSVHDMPPSPQPSGSWSQSAMIEQDYTQSSQPPDIFTDAFDPFSAYTAACQTATCQTGMIPAQSPAPDLVYNHSTPGSNLDSHRSSISSSYSPCESISRHESGYPFTPPKVKVEEARGWYQPHGNPPYSFETSPLHAPTGDGYRHNQGGWPKSDPPGYPMFHQDDHFDRRMITSRVRGKEQRCKRKRTTPEEATHECDICGRLFKRSYNWKSHKETHNPDRKYPHPCTAIVGNTPCIKKFQRKTDLDRHHESVSFGSWRGKREFDINSTLQVHLKAKNYECTLCEKRFARRDTLRR